MPNQHRIFLIIIDSMLCNDQPTKKLKVDVGFVIDQAVWETNAPKKSTPPVPFEDHSSRQGLRIMASAIAEGLFKNDQDVSVRMSLIMFKPIQTANLTFPLIDGTNWDAFKSALDRIPDFKIQRDLRRHWNMKGAAKNVREALEKSPGNRMTAYDLIIWFGFYPHTGRHGEKDLDPSVVEMMFSKENQVDVFILMVRLDDATFDDSIYFNGASWLGRYGFDFKLDEVNHHIVRYIISDTLVLGCKNGFVETRLEQCHFDKDGICFSKMKIVPNPPPDPHPWVGVVPIYCPSGTGSDECPTVGECDRNCDSMNPKKETACSAKCGKGTKKVRPDSDDDQFYVHCPWKEVECTGTDCGGEPTDPPEPTKQTQPPPATDEEPEPTETDPGPVKPPTRRPKETPSPEETSSTSTTKLPAAKGATTPKEVLESWMIAVIVVGALGLIAILVLIAVCAVVAGKKRRRARQQAPYKDRRHSRPPPPPPPSRGYDSRRYHSEPPMSQTRTECPVSTTRPRDRSRFSTWWTRRRSESRGTGYPTTRATSCTEYTRPPTRDRYGGRRR